MTVHVLPPPHPSSENTTRGNSLFRYISSLSMHARMLPPRFPAAKVGILPTVADSFIPLLLTLVVFCRRHDRDYESCAPAPPTKEGTVLVKTEHVFGYAELLRHALFLLPCCPSFLLPVRTYVYSQGVNCRRQPQGFSCLVPSSHNTFSPY